MKNLQRGFACGRRFNLSLTGLDGHNGSNLIGSVAGLGDHQVVSPTMVTGGHSPIIISNVHDGSRLDNLHKYRPETFDKVCYLIHHRGILAEIDLSIWSGNCPVGDSVD